MEWPKYLPECCPPDDAESKSVPVYRFLKSQGIKPEYFLSVREESPSRKFSESEKECRACSLSVFTKKEEVVRLQKTVPRWRKPVAVGKIEKTSGKVKHTPSPNTNNSHHSWWVPTNVKAWSLFHEILEPPKST